MFRYFSGYDFFIWCIFDCLIFDCILFCFCRNIVFFIFYVIVFLEKLIDVFVDWGYVREYYWFSCYFFCLLILVGIKYDFVVLREFCDCDMRKL